MSNLIEFKGVGKRYILRKQKPFLLHDMLRTLVRGRRTHYEEFWALQDVTFHVGAGETIGIIGPNGAGKSTILGIVSGCIAPTTGSVTVAGRIGALLELGAGFHPDLTGRENIYLNASLMGLDKQEINDEVESIIAFSELGGFIDAPLRQYSSGMQVRLGFSVATYIHPDILIMDEALAVGDRDFHKKCVQRMRQFQEKKTTMLLVSHNLGQVRLLCSRVLWIEHGRVRMAGRADDVTAAYMAAHSAGPMAP